MNLFVTGWNLPLSLSASAFDALKLTAKAHPLLDIWAPWRLHRGKVFAAGICTERALCGPRVYLAKDEDQAVFFDGLPVASAGGFDGHDANSLKTRWASIDREVRGQFVLARADFTAQTLEVVTDWLGMLQVYWLSRDGWWMVSNSAGLLSQAAGVCELDPLGVGMYLTMNRPWDDRTLYKEIHVIPGGRRLLWSDDEVQISSYHSPEHLLTKRQRRLGKFDIAALARDLADPCVRISRHLPIRCPITGGRDSRVLTAILLKNDIPARYITEGEPGSADVEIARLIAAQYGLDHDLVTKNSSAVLEQWDECSNRIVRRCDGMVSIWQIADVMDSPVGVYETLLSGLGGEVARGYYYTPLDAMTQLSVDDVVDRLAVSNYEGLVDADLTAEVARHTREYIGHVFDMGHRGVDAIDIFYLYEPMRRWGGTNMRKAAWRSDTFIPMMDLPFIEAAFSMPARYRCCHALHKELLRVLEPRLLDVPLDRGSWPRDWPLANLLQWAGQKAVVRARLPRRRRHKWRQPVFDHEAWVNARMAWMRNVCLSRKNSPLWQFINRPKLEELLTGSKWTANKGMMFGAFLAATLFLFESKLSTARGFAAA
jgi:asparagine synthase (glutamine-hydrolysing)